MCSDVCEELKGRRQFGKVSTLFFLLWLCEAAEFVCGRKPEMDLIDGLKTKAVDVYSLASRTKKVFSLQFHGGKREDPE